MNHNCENSFTILEKKKKTLLLLSDVVMCTTLEKPREQSWLPSLGVSLEMRPWVCVNPQTAEEELEVKPKRPWITACERRGVCVKVNPWSMQMSLEPSDSLWIHFKVVWNLTKKCFVERCRLNGSQSAWSQSRSRLKGMSCNQSQWTFKIYSLSS